MGVPVPTSYPLPRCGHSLPPSQNVLCAGVAWNGQPPVSGRPGSFQSWETLLRVSTLVTLDSCFPLLLTWHTHCPPRGVPLSWRGLCPLCLENGCWRGSWLYTTLRGPTVKTKTQACHFSAFHVLTPPTAESSEFRNEARDQLAVPRCLLATWQVSVPRLCRSPLPIRPTDSPCWAPSLSPGDPAFKALPPGTGFRRRFQGQGVRAVSVSSVTPANLLPPCSLDCKGTRGPCSQDP